MSRLVWARGLKLMISLRRNTHQQSRLVWARGLKLVCFINNDQRELVAPRVGAWIETIIKGCALWLTLCRASCGRVD